MYHTHITCDWKGCGKVLKDEADLNKNLYRSVRIDQYTFQVCNHCFNEYIANNLPFKS